MTGRVRIAQFNDVDGLADALGPADVAIVLTEPAMTNRVHLLAPEPGWHQDLRALTRAHGDAAGAGRDPHPRRRAGGATGRWGLDPDVVTIGKAVAGGVPMGASGSPPRSARSPPRGSRHRRDAVREPAVGRGRQGGADRGPGARRLRAPARLGAKLADGIDRDLLQRPALDVIRFGPRSGQWYGPQPRTGSEAFALTDKELTRLLRIWLANRGVWEALPGAGPTVPVPAAPGRRGSVPGAYAELLEQLTR